MLEDFEFNEGKKPQSTKDPTSSETTQHDSIVNSSNIQNETITVKKSTYNNLMKGAVVTIAIAAFFGGYLTSTIDDSTTNQDLLDAIEEIENLQQTPSPAVAQAPATAQPIRVSLDDDPIRGEPDAPVTIVEFSDFQCPFCARFHSNTLPQIEQNYISTGKVNFVYRDFPLPSIHPNAIPAALASECADDQGRFWEYHDKLFENQREWQGLDLQTGVSTFKEYAQELDLNMDEFNSCLDSEKYAQEVNKDGQDGRDYGVTGTPGFFVGNEKIGFTKITGAQPYSVFQRLIDGQLEQ